MMKTLFFLCFTLLAFPVIAYSSEQNNQSEIKRPLEIAFEKIVEECWAVSETHRASSNLFQQDKGTQLTQACMRNNIIRLAKPMFKDNGFFEKYFLNPLDEGFKLYETSLKALHHDHDKCPNECGQISILHVSHSLVSYYEPILKDAIYKNWEFFER